MSLKLRSVFIHSSNAIVFNNKNLHKTVVWVKSDLGQKKYYIPNEINITKNLDIINFVTFKYFYFKYCVLFHTLIRNNIYGLLRGFKSYIVIRGLGFKASVENNAVIFKLGFSHSITYEIPNDVKISVLPKKSRALRIFGQDYQYVKEIVARIKNFKKPNSYKDQGIFFYKSSRKLKDSKKKSR